MNKKILGGILTSIFLLALLTTFFILKTTHTPKNNAIPAENIDNNVAIDNTKPDTDSPDYETYKKIRTAAQEVADAQNSYYEHPNQSDGIMEKLGLEPEAYLSKEDKDLCEWQLPDDTKYNQQLTMTNGIPLYCVDQQKVLKAVSLHFHDANKFEQTGKFLPTTYKKGSILGGFNTVVEHPVYYTQPLFGDIPYRDDFGIANVHQPDIEGGHLSNNPPKENESLLEYTQRIRQETDKLGDKLEDE